MNIELQYGATFSQTFGGESNIEGWKHNDYGFEIGEMSVHNIRGAELSRLVVAGMNHLMLNGHKFEFVKTDSTDLPIEVKEVV